MLLCRIKKLLSIIFILLLCGCASVENPHPHDPIENFNRGVYRFNKAVDKVVIKPVAYVYKGVIPVALQQGVGNFFDNIEEITTVANDILQFKFGYAIQDVTRFFINTTFGIGGIFDVASRVGIEQRKEDFGQTLYRWGYHHSTYFVIPFLGPSTVRDVIGRGVDRYALSPWPWVDDDEWRYGLSALSIIDTRAALLHKETVLDTIAVDEYTFIRNAYLQRRAFLGQDLSSQPAEASDPFDGFEEDDLNEAEVPAE